MSNKKPQLGPFGDTLVDFLQVAAESYGSRDALLFKPGFRYHRWSYRDVWESAGRVATLLQQHGVKKGDRVLIWAPNSPHWVLALFGTIRAGAVAVPLDLNCADDFAGNVAARTRPAAAFVSRMTPGSHEAFGVPEVYFEDMERLAHGLPQPRPVELAAGDLAEVVFTSGTTGNPKGVMLTHGNLTANIRSVGQFFPGNPSDRLLSVLPLSHMFEQMGGLFVAMRSGASITYPTSRQPTVLSKTMRERRVTLMLLVPQGLELLMGGIEREVRRQGKEGLWNRLLALAGRLPFGARRRLFGSVHRRLGGHLELIVCGGAALDQELAAKWELLGIRIAQGYGATEASPVISFHRQEDPRYDSVGPPVPDVDVRIADDGEVLVRGPNVTGGYWEAPEATEEAFEDGWYKTGDQGFLDDEGFLHLRGRKKDMIVLPDGQNVFPEDIEAVLGKHEGVTDAVVVGLSEGSSVEVHAALILADGADPDETVSWANARLAPHQRIRGHTMWPGEDFPRTHTLKVKKGLVVDVLSGSAPERPAAPRPAGAARARGPLDIVSEITGYPMERLRPDMTLGEDLNLDSLGRVSLLSAIDEELGVYLDESQANDETTVGEIEEMVRLGAGNRAHISFPRWGMSWWCRGVRGAIQRALLFPVMRLAYRLSVKGQEHLLASDQPMVFAANHNLPWDNGLIIKAIPNSRRRRLSIAGAATLWRNPFFALINPLLGNGFPFSQEGAVRASLENVGDLLDQGWTVLIYPEGKLTTGGPIQPFLAGTGLLTVEGRLPVIPIRLVIHHPGSPVRFPFLRRGDIEVRFGPPITFPPGTAYDEATAAIERTVKSL